MIAAAASNEVQRRGSRAEAQTARTVDPQFQRLRVRSADEVDRRVRARVAGAAPRIGGTGRALRANGAGRSCRASGTGVAFVALRPGRSGWARVALRAGRSR